MSGRRDGAWGEAIGELLGARTEKPRATGITAILDKGLGLRAVDDLAETAGHLVDHVKLGFGSSAALDGAFLARKVARLVEAGIVVYPGGTLLEAAWATGHLAAYLRRACELGFTGVEVSDGTVDLPAASRQEAIERALDVGLTVISEVGRKDPRRQLTPAEMADRAGADLALGVAFVTIEARESGRGTGIFDATGHVDEGILDALLAALPDRSRILWEAPLHDQQAYLILRLGTNVNLANIGPGEVLALEALRRGLRFETLRAALQREPAGAPGRPPR